jgi:perosamine synthetase
VASANAIVYERARPVFVDVDPDTFNIDPAAIEAAITPRTTAILPVHIFGYPADMPAIEQIAAKHGLAIVEDACEALGAMHADGLPVGGRGHPAVFGFYANKQITTGEGGAIALGDPAHKTRIDSERNQGRAPDMAWLDHDRLGFNYRLSDLACALGVVQIQRLDELLKARASVARLYVEALSDEAELRLPAPDLDGDIRSWFVFVVQLPSNVDRERIISRLGERGIQAKPYLPAIHTMSFYQEHFGCRGGEHPICEDVSARSLALPFFAGMTEEEISAVAHAVIDLIAT